jgi:hypothetical protein
MVAGRGAVARFYEGRREWVWSERNRSGMQFIHRDLGHRQRGEIVEVQISAWVNGWLEQPQ